MNSEDNVAAALEKNDPQELHSLVIGVALYAPDFEWAQNICIRLATHDDPFVRGNAVLGFGHLARRFRKQDHEAVRPLLKLALLDTSEYVRGQAVSAKDDVEAFLGWVITL